MAKIEGIYAREILDSRGMPTIECALWLDTGAVVATSVPTGTSVGKYEALELKDGDMDRMLGKGVLNAVNNVNNVISKSIIGMDPTEQTQIDQMLVDLDGSDNKSNLGANAILAASQAVLKAGAISLNVPLYYYIEKKYQLTTQLNIPSCIYTMINGGEHGADNLDIQEFQIIPASHIGFSKSMDMAVTLRQKIEEILILKGATHSTGIVGGFTPNLYSNTDVFEILIETIKTSPYTFAQDIFFGVDVAAEQLFSDGKYKLRDKSQLYSSEELIEFYKKIRSLYHVFLIEDPFQEDDLASWAKLTTDLGETTKIVGDSFLATNINKVQKAILEKTCNTILVKPNQTGTISETIEVIKEAKKAGWQVIMSHRSGETNDDFIADFAVGVGADYTKFGPPNRGERVAKYNRLSQIDFEIKQSDTTTNNTNQTTINK
ncbi:MAG: phosphopyruvate hydratase [Candidatus Pacebacteria bacterium CG_4_10_14_3_um_filter_34_15]|nr:phosphopyruvate hydratase [Candidatus Pacearchaeota archaeon]NCQ65724.1 phosphopyruvate hydratase [Candidatus Paceibacterota bacterium]OIO44722.1 MAG: phosphopyruvate hydratase [Candidatus Pacebacteria bacterium CG1_02_43_31]PIQ81264.1 MAG: phosphopyruvate hydratase [Candidatus Pacebacteria bacterium CG11_big_fil_rev_8_21_14_0_20_34_55]PIX82044.1 MAG: phosphopyruvate hydratase [Candidatus Pacebacteria bacterium CG_4_10_14_3_um_filter_34_15]PJC43740.1 MAG: phosphopyruvate hydratase [Candidat